MSTDQPEENPYELLGLGTEASEQKIKSTYRKLSLKVHPDRNPNNPDAAQKFHELNQAYELLLDPLRRLALNSSVKAAEARKARFAKLDKRKREMQDALEEAERAAKKQHVDGVPEARRREQENERIKDAGRKLREERMEAMRKQEELEVQEHDNVEEEDEVPPLGQLDTTVKLKYTLASHPDLTTASAIASLLSQFGEVDTSSIVLSLKPPKKAPTKPPKNGTALAPFRQIGGALAAVGASGRQERGLEDVEITWAGGQEPPILDWLKKQGKLDPYSGAKEGGKPRQPGSPKPNVEKQPDIFSKLSSKPGLSSFSSFPDSFPSAPDLSSSAAPESLGPSLDYESLTLMRLRQAERQRLEREIREQEAND